ncbi:hypothetical protein C0995_006079, partial [Termitomyces sp. Mi166
SRLPTVEDVLEEEEPDDENAADSDYDSDKGPAPKPSSKTLGAVSLPNADLLRGALFGSETPPVHRRGL